MEDDKAAKELINLLEQEDGLGSIPAMTIRDMACMVLPDLDYEAQLIAISDLLAQHGDADAKTTNEIKAVEAFARKSTGLRNEQAVDEWISLLHGSTYESAAHSMAALGMLAPLLESLFYQAFQGIRAEFFTGKPLPAGHPRSALDPDDFWDCHYIFIPSKPKKPQKEVVKGIRELAEAISLTPHLPPQLWSLLEPLFRYRNKMFHFGFEWPADECTKFDKQIRDNNWHDLFSNASRNGVPFIFYMNESFISQCVALIHELLESFGSYCEAALQAKLT